jgi:hypothetical protein
MLAEARRRLWDSTGRNAPRWTDCTLQLRARLLEQLAQAAVPERAETAPQSSARTPGLAEPQIDRGEYIP